MNQTVINNLATKINSKEQKSNKVTSLSSSSTDTQYPSAKAVYDALSEAAASNEGNYIYDFYLDSSNDDIVLEYDSASGGGSGGGSSASNIFDLDPPSQYGDIVVEEGVDKDGTGLGYGNDMLLYNSQETKFYYDKNGNADNDNGNELATMNDIPSLTNYVQKSNTSGLIKNDGTIDTVPDILGTAFYNYKLSSSHYNPPIDSTVTLTCKVTNVLGNNVANKTLTLYYNDVSLGTSTTNANGEATWSYTFTDWYNYRFTCENASLELKGNGWKTLLDSSGYLIRTKDNRVQFILNVDSVSFPTTFTAFGGGAKVPTGYRPYRSVVVPCKSNYPLFVAILPDGTVERRTFNSSQQTAGCYAFAEWTI